MNSSGVHCVWLKRDLRLTDHRPLVEAVASGDVILLYVIEPEVINAPDFDAMHWEFIRESLEDLNRQLKDVGGCLVIERGEMTEVLDRLHETYTLRGLWSHEETGNTATFLRDKRVARWVARHEVHWTEYPQNGVIRRLKDRDGWARNWEHFMNQALWAPPQDIRFANQLADAAFLPTSQMLGLAESERSCDLKGGEAAGFDVLHTFLNERGMRYHREMSSPNTAFTSCSRLSPYLSWGCLSMRTVVRVIRQAAGEGFPKVAARAVVSRLHWHCHFMQKLESEPAIEFHAFNPACDHLREDSANRADLLSLWKAGQTGYPFIDACMRALKARGWINFRMRAMLVSFASYHLWVDWRAFKDWLACQFIDYEPGIHISQIQMQSGLTGINTLRIYNPIKQGQDHDLEGTFIREWVPELREVSDVFIHEPWKMHDAAQAAANCMLGRSYPLPIVDHKEAVRYARAQFSLLRKREDYWAASKEVLEKHGSRKGTARPKKAKPSAASQGEFSFEASTTAASHSPQS